MFKHAFSPLVGLAAIFSISFWAVRIGQSCELEGCIDVVLVIGWGLIALGIQLLILVPVDAWSTHKRGEPVFPRLAGWVGLSIAAFILPLLLLFLIDVQ